MYNKWNKEQASSYQGQIEGKTKAAYAQIAQVIPEKHEIPAQQGHDQDSGKRQRPGHHAQNRVISHVNHFVGKYY